MRDQLPYFPHDKLSGSNLDANLAADVCELAAFFSEGQEFLLSDLRNDIEIGGDEYEDIDEHNRLGNEVIDVAAAVIERRRRLLGAAYPFNLDENGAAVVFLDDQNWPHAGYLLSLVLSHLKALSPVLDADNLQPSNADITRLRDWFQKIAAPALAAELHEGIAWAFGHPRTDKSLFLKKLQEIWAQINDGTVVTKAPPGAPKKVKDAKIDVIAARPHPDGDPGFPILVAQVGTGKDWAEKSVRGVVDNVLFAFWFAVPPASQVQAYHVVPFTIEAEEMRLQTLQLGHILHRLRLVRLLADAESGIEDRRICSEGTEVFGELTNWLARYRSGGAQDAA